MYKGLCDWIYYPIIFRIVHFIQRVFAVRTERTRREEKGGKVKFYFYNPRDYVKPTKSQKKNDKPYLRVDDKPYGGGPGMVMQAEPLIRSMESALKKIKSKIKF